MIILLEHINNDWIDSHLRFVLANTCNICESEITKDFLSKIEEIDLSDKNINNLKGIQFAKNIKKLILSRNKIKNANYINSLTKLTNLELSENKIEDIFFISNLRNLKTLNLENNNICKVPDLSSLKNLESINISNNRISDLCFIDSLKSNEIRVFAADQCILLKPVLVGNGYDYIFYPRIFWDKDTIVYCDNIQITGEYESIDIDEKPSILYSISKVTINKVLSDCIIKADFYHEVLFSKSGIFSGIIIQPILTKSTNDKSDIDNLKKHKDTGIIYGSLRLSNNFIENMIENRTITLIDSKGETLYTKTGSKGEYEFENLKSGTYTLLYPFIEGYKYLSPSLYRFNLRRDECLEINSTIILE